jgi:hypothetical protein
MSIRNRLIAIILTLLALTLLVGLLLAAFDPSLPRHLVSSGGGLIEGDGLKLNSAIGQPVVGIESGGPGEVSLCSGFLCAEPFQGTQEIYLPFVVRGSS